MKREVGRRRTYHVSQPRRPTWRKPVTVVGGVCAHISAVQPTQHHACRARCQIQTHTKHRETTQPHTMATQQPPLHCERSRQRQEAPKTAGPGQRPLPSRRCATPGLTSARRPGPRVAPGSLRSAAFRHSAVWSVAPRRRFVARLDIAVATLVRRPTCDRGSEATGDLLGAVWWKAARVVGRGRAEWGAPGGSRGIGRARGRSHPWVRIATA